VSNRANNGKELRVSNKNLNLKLPVYTERMIGRNEDTSH
jgi:hypothetical protein